MKKNKIAYQKKWLPSPATYWVHIEVPPKKMMDSMAYTPPLQEPIKGLGYPRFFVEYDGLELEFSSLFEIDHYIQILSQKNLPTTTALSKLRFEQTQKPVSFNPERSHWRNGPNKHWLSRLPAKTKAWSFREGLVKYLKTSLKAFKKEISNN